jgi:hypothetical protein
VILPRSSPKRCPARYFHAKSADDLKAVYDVLSRQLVVETREMEVTAFLPPWPPC